MKATWVFFSFLTVSCNEIKPPRMSQLKQIFYASTQPLVVNKFSFLITKQVRAPILREEVFLLLANID